MDKKLFTDRKPRGQKNRGNIKHYFVSGSKTAKGLPQTKKALYWRKKIAKGIALSNKAFVTVADIKSLITWKTKKKSIIKAYKKVNKKVSLFKTVKKVKTTSPTVSRRDYITTTSDSPS